MLVAVGLWSPLWRSRRVWLTLRSDNIGALSIFSAVRGRSTSLNLLAREYALDMSAGTFEPDFIEHIPGISNAVADELSCKNDPQYKKSWSVPSFLAKAKEIIPPPRFDTWWRTRVVSQT